METHTLTFREVEQAPRKDEVPVDHGYRTRRCSECGDWLCRWNEGPTCYRHSAHNYRMVESAEDLRELMETP